MSGFRRCLSHRHFLGGSSHQIESVFRSLCFDQVCLGSIQEFKTTSWGAIQFLTTAASIQGTHFQTKACFTSTRRTLLCGLVATCCNLHPLTLSKSHALLCIFMYFPSYSACSSYSLQFVSLWNWGPESSVWLLGFVDICSGVALLGSVAQRSLFRWIPLTSLTYDRIALVLRFACRIETLPGPHRRVLFKTGAICRPLFHHQSDPGKVWITPL